MPLSIPIPSEQVRVAALNTLTTLNLSKITAGAIAGFNAGIYAVYQGSLWLKIPKLQDPEVLLSGGLFVGIVAVVGLLIDARQRIVTGASPVETPAPSTDSLISAMIPHVENAVQSALDNKLPGAVNSAVGAAVSAAVPQAVSAHVGAILGTPQNQAQG
jgi:hypothetical protein